MDDCNEPGYRVSPVEMMGPSINSSWHDCSRRCRLFWSNRAWPESRDLLRSGPWAPSSFVTHTVFDPHEGFRDVPSVRTREHHGYGFSTSRPAALPFLARGAVLGSVLQHALAVAVSEMSGLRLPRRAALAPGLEATRGTRSEVTAQHWAERPGHWRARTGEEKASLASILSPVCYFFRFWCPFHLCVNKVAASKRTRCITLSCMARDVNSGLAKPSSNFNDQFSWTWFNFLSKSGHRYLGHRWVITSNEIP